MPKATPEPTKRADIFGAARSLYTRRKSLLEKADALLEQADEPTRLLCLKLEEHDASQSIDMEPSSPEASETSEPVRMVGASRQ